MDLINWNRHIEAKHKSEWNTRPHNSLVSLMELTLTVVNHLCFLSLDIRGNNLFSIRINEKYPIPLMIFSCSESRLPITMNQQSEMKEYESVQHCKPSKVYCHSKHRWYWFILPYSISTSPIVILSGVPLTKLYDHSRRCRSAQSESSIAYVGGNTRMDLSVNII